MTIERLSQISHSPEHIAARCAHLIAELLGAWDRRDESTSVDENGKNVDGQLSVGIKSKRPKREPGTSLHGSSEQPGQPVSTVHSSRRQDIVHQQRIQTRSGQSSSTQTPAGDLPHTPMQQQQQPQPHQTPTDYFQTQHPQSSSQIPPPSFAIP